MSARGTAAKKNVRVASETISVKLGSHARALPQNCYVPPQVIDSYILYVARFTNRQCVALFDRARGSIAATAVTDVALTPEVAADLAGRFGKTYVEP